MNSMDFHMDVKKTDQEIKAEMMSCAEQARAISRGSVPQEIQDMLGELEKPSLTADTAIRSLFARKSQEAGMNNDWRRLRRRYLSTNPIQYLPNRFKYKIKWLAAIDTSGSMTRSDMTFGVSQLQVWGNDTDGTVVPMDVTAKWKDAIKINNSSETELKKIKLTGRGGTDFTDFFKGYRDNLGKDFDVIMVITDGDCGTVPIEYKPRIPVLWILTRNNTGFVPPFEKVAYLRIERP
jgi:predicted metal-dependent peptidase